MGGSGQVDRLRVLSGVHQLGSPRSNRNPVVPLASVTSDQAQKMRERRAFNPRAACDR
ncbi:MAG: hypothetical protein VX641_02790 [Planctomycetota bacterium]|nr:hypothetical protein [Planctomycetota bacterium]